MISYGENGDFQSNTTLVVCNYRAQLIARYQGDLCWRIWDATTIISDQIRGDVRDMGDLFFIPQYLREILITVVTDAISTQKFQASNKTEQKFILSRIIKWLVVGHTIDSGTQCSIGLKDILDGIN